MVVGLEVALLVSEVVYDDVIVVVADVDVVGEVV